MKSFLKKFLQILYVISLLVFLNEEINVTKRHLAVDHLKLFLSKNKKELCNKHVEAFKVNNYKVHHFSPINFI